MGIRQSVLKFVRMEWKNMSSEEVQFTLKVIKKLKIKKQLYNNDQCGENCSRLAKKLEEKVNSGPHGSDWKTKVEKNNRVNSSKASHTGEGKRAKEQQFKMATEVMLPSVTSLTIRTVDPGELITLGPCSSGITILYQYQDSCMFYVVNVYKN